MTFRSSICTFGCLVAFLFTNPVWAQSETARAQARGHLAEARKLYEAGDPAGSLRKLEAEYELVPSPKILFSFGQTYRGLGRDPEALESFERFLAEAKGIDPKLQAETRQYVEDLRKRVGQIDLTTDTTGADVRVDGMKKGVTPLARALIVTPGVHSLEIKRDGSPLSYAEQITASAGEIVHVRARLTNPSVGAGSLFPPTQAPPPTRGLDLSTRPVPTGDDVPIYKRSWFWPVAGGAVALVTVLVIVAASSGGGTNVPQTTLGSQRAFQ